MRGKSKNITRQIRSASRVEAPQQSDELLALDNELARERMPKELAVPVTRQVTICAPGKEIEQPTLIQSRQTRGAWEIELPSGAALGLPGREGRRFTVDDLKRGTKANTHAEPFRPKWVDYLPHPKIGSRSQPLMRRLKGQWVRPHYGVFGSDDRQVYFPSGYPWTCIGRIFVWNDFSKPNWAWSGSGVLVGGRVVLTAGHVAPRGSSNWAMQFIPAYFDGASALGSGVSSWVSDYVSYAGDVSAWDMSVLRLYTPLGDTLGYFGAKTYDSGWQGGNYWTLAGYPGMVAGANRPSRQMWFPIVDDDSDGDADELEFYADSTAGDSGGPVFGFWSGSPYVIGTASGGEINLEQYSYWAGPLFGVWAFEDDNVAAGGSAMVNLIRWARSNWL